MVGDSLAKTSSSVAIVQARMGSSRLPGKMMMPLGGRPLLFWVLYRVKKASLIKSVTLAISQNKIDDPLVDLAQQLEINIYRGSEDDVLDRFRGAAESAEAKNIVRICGDNPLVAPEEIDRLVASYESVLKKENHSRLYAYNYGPRLGNNYPNGLGGEIFSSKLLLKLDQFATLPSHREHVCAYIWHYPKNFTIHTVKAPKKIAYPGIKLDVDTKEDLRRLNILCKQLNLESSAIEIVETYNKLFNLGR